MRAACLGMIGRHHDGGYVFTVHCAATLDTFSQYGELGIALCAQCFMHAGKDD